jgi:16S rRNA G527 N7-methylase RsmG
LELTAEAAGKLFRYHDWLATEAIAAGGLGPGETSRIWDRHIADSLVCAFPWAATPPPALADLGSGVGLPGIPLAIAFPATRLTLIDRSGRRCGLVRRAARILDLDLTVVEADIVTQASLLGTFPAVVSRATLPLDVAVATIPEFLEPGGVAVIPFQRGGSRPSVVEPPSAGTEVSIVAVPDNVLDATVWLLRMQVRDDDSH